MEGIELLLMDEGFAVSNDKLGIPRLGCVYSWVIAFSQNAASDGKPDFRFYVLMIGLVSGSKTLFFSSSPRKGNSRRSWGRIVRCKTRREKKEKKCAEYFQIEINFIISCIYILVAAPRQITLCGV